MTSISNNSPLASYFSNTAKPSTAGAAGSGSTTDKPSASAAGKPPSSTSSRASLWAWLTNVPLIAVSAWNEFAATLVILSSAGNQPLSVALTKFVGQYETSWYYVFGVSIVAVLPAVILFRLIEKRLVGGLTAGSVK